FYFLLLLPNPLRATLFPYTTLFRSGGGGREARAGQGGDRRCQLQLPRQGPGPAQGRNGDRQHGGRQELLRATQGSRQVPEANLGSGRRGLSRQLIDAGTVGDGGPVSRESLPVRWRQYQPEGRSVARREGPGASAVGTSDHFRFS